MISSSGGAELAFANVGRAIDPGRCFPENVFWDARGRYFFFDSDWIFDARFGEHIKALLEAEGGGVACMVDFEAASDGTNIASRFLDATITPEAYQDLICSPRAESQISWIDVVSRFGCTSDKSRWCIYCEKSAEIAVIALKDDFPLENAANMLEHLAALPIAQAIAVPHSYGFENMLPEWRRRLLDAYRVLPG